MCVPGVSHEPYAFESGYSNVIRLDYVVYNYEKFTVSGAQEAPVAVFTNALPVRSAYVGGKPWNSLPAFIPATDGKRRAAHAACGGGASSGNTD